MDPDETYRIMCNEDLDLVDRVAAALELSRWLFNGGYFPAALSYDNVRTQTDRIRIDQRRNYLRSFNTQCVWHLDCITGAKNG